MTCTTIQTQDSRNPKKHKEPDLPESGKYSGQTGSDKHVKQK